MHAQSNLHFEINDINDLRLRGRHSRNREPLFWLDSIVLEKHRDGLPVMDPPDGLRITEA